MPNHRTNIVYRKWNKISRKRTVFRYFSMMQFNRWSFTRWGMTLEDIQASHKFTLANHLRGPIFLDKKRISMEYDTAIIFLQKGTTGQEIYFETWNKIDFLLYKRRVQRDSTNDIDLNFVWLGSWTKKFDTSSILVKRDKASAIWDEVPELSIQWWGEYRLWDNCVDKIIPHSRLVALSCCLEFKLNFVLLHVGTCVTG